MLEELKQLIANNSEKNLNIMLGTITSLDPNNYAAKVMLEPTGIETGWIRIASIQVGDGWGIMAIPNIGDEVLVAFVYGSLDYGIIIGRMFNDIDYAPTGLNPGDMIMMSKNGSYFKLSADGHITIHSEVGVTISGPSNTSTW